MYDSANQVTADDDEELVDPNDHDAIAVEESGEEEASGTASSPDSDDDVGEMVKEFSGVDPDPDMDNPQELNTEKEVEDAEKAFQES